MKLAIIHGQNHKGSTYHIARMLAECLATKEEITEFFLPRDLNHFCLGCYQCLEGENHCPFYEEKQKIMKAIEESELLIFTTPVYCLRASAPMKSFLDLTFTNWMTHKPKTWMFSKKAVIIATSAGASPKAAMKDIKTALVYWGVPYIKTYGVRVQAMNWNGVKEKKRAEIEQHITKLVHKIERVKAPRIGIKTRLLFFMMRGMQNANLGASPIEKQYWNEKGWLEKGRPWNK